MGGHTPGRRARGIAFTCIIAMAAVVALSACGADGGEGAAGEDGATGGEVTIALPPVQVQHLDRQIANSTFDMVYNVADPVFRLDAEGEFNPGLAESWEFVEDGVLRIKLHENITFSDGEDLDAEAFKISMDRMLSSESTMGADHFSTIEEVRVVDEHTVEVVHEPDVLLLKELAMQAVIYSPKQVEEDPDSIQTNPIGSGPYEVESYSPGSSLTLVARDDYWGADLFSTPKVEKATLVFDEEAGVRLARLQAGEAELVSNIGHDDVSDLDEDAVIEGLAPEIYYGRFGLADELSSDVRVRRAVSLAIDQEQIAQVFGDGADPAYQIWPEYAVGWAERPIPETDIVEARSLIQEAGAEGEQVTVAFSSDYKPGMRDVTQVVAEMIGETGLTVELQDMDGTTFRQDMRDKSAPPFMHIVSNGYELLDAMAIANRIECEGAVSTYCNEEVDDLLGAARDEPDPEARTEILQQMHDILDEEVPLIPFVNPSILYAKSSELQLSEEWTVFGDLRMTELQLDQ